MADTAEITQWLDAARDGDRGALDRVLARRLGLNRPSDDLVTSPTIRR